VVNLCLLVAADVQVMRVQRDTLNNSRSVKSTSTHTRTLIPCSHPQPPPLALGSVTITTESSTDDATTLSRMNLSGYVGHVTVFS